MLATLSRDAKAELNRRSQACEVLTGTGIRVAENESLSSEALAKEDRASGYRALYSGLEDRCVSVNTYARRIGLPSRSSESEGWNPVLELHQPLRFCKPPPDLLGQRDKLKVRAETCATARVF